MPKLISGYIRGQIAKHLGPHVLDATLIKVASGTRTAGNQSAGTNPTETSYAAKGWAASYDGHQIPGTLVKQDDRMIALLGGTIDGGVEPEVGDKIMIEDPPGGEVQTFRIIGGHEGGRGVTRDPDGAKYVCHGRR